MAIGVAITATALLVTVSDQKTGAHGVDGDQQRSSGAMLVSKGSRLETIRSTVPAFSGPLPKGEHAEDQNSACSRSIAPMLPQARRQRKRHHDPYFPASAGRFDPASRRTAASSAAPASVAIAMGACARRNARALASPTSVRPTFACSAWAASLPAAISKAVAGPQASAGGLGAGDTARPNQSEHAHLQPGQ